jgi:two-component system chemotaxis response regulator CheY
MPTRILVVEDDDEIRSVTVDALADEGYAVDQAVDGAAALDCAAAAPPDLILLDMRMPILSGWDFVREYRGRPGTHAPIVVMSAASDTEARAAEVDADGVLIKPFDLDVLLDTVARHCRPPSRP